LWVKGGLMFYEMITRKRDAWILRPDCPVRETVRYMLGLSKSGAGLREIQIDAIMIDEAHHTASQGDKSDEVKLRAVVNNWAASEVGVNSVMGFSGTPYLDKLEKVELGAGLAFKTEEIASTVYYYPLVRGVGDFLKKPTVTIVSGDTEPLAIVRRGVREFFEKFGRRKYANGSFAKLAIYCGGVDRLEEEIYPEVAKIVKRSTSFSRSRR